jgi:hypothetical protein
MNQSCSRARSDVNIAAGPTLGASLVIVLGLGSRAARAWDLLLSNYQASKLQSSPIRNTRFGPDNISLRASNVYRIPC